MLMSPTRAKQLSMAATARVIWLCACVRYWPYRGVGRCAPCFQLVLFQWFGFTFPFSTEKWLGLQWKEYQRKVQLCFQCSNSSLPLPRSQDFLKRSRTLRTPHKTWLHMISRWSSSNDLCFHSPGDGTYCTLWESFITRKQVTFFSNW